jgi:hypothetical protein
VTRTFTLLTLTAAGCTLGGVDALPPYDAAPRPGSEIAPDAARRDAAACVAAANTDGDGLSDCDELGDGNPVTDPAVFNGLTAIIGDRPEGTGSCSALDDYAEMASRFATPVRSQDVYAGWEFETDADSYADASYGFVPAWDDAPSERFSVRYSGWFLPAGAGTHCFRIDVGARGTGIVSGKNRCAQLYLGAGPAWLVETGYLAESETADEACAELGAAAVKLDIAFWYFNVLETATLRVRYCYGGDAACAPDTVISALSLQAGV